MAVMCSDLKAERKKLLAIRDEINRRLDAVDLLLRPLDLDGFRTEPVITANDVLSASAGSFAAKVRAVLIARGPCKASDIAEALSENGKKDSKLAIRVASELARMENRGAFGVTRISRGVYGVINGYGDANASP